MVQIPSPIEAADPIAAVDWAATPLGPRQGWPAHLGTVVDLMMASPLSMMLLWGRDPVVIYNAGYRALVGARHPQPFGGRIADVWPEQWERSRGVVERAFAGEPTVFRDQPFQVERGGLPEDVWFDLFYAPVRDPGGAVTGALCTAVETSTHVHALNRHAESERRLAQSEARLSMLVNQASVGISQSDLAGRLVAANDRFCAIIGRTKADVVGASIEAFTHPDDRAASRQASDRLRQDGKAYISEKRLLRPDGSSVWVSHHVSLAYDAAGLPEFIIRITQDISAHKEAELVARDSTDRMQLALSTGAVLGTWVWEPRSQQLSGDARFAQTLGLAPEAAAAGMPLEEALRSIHWEDRAVIRDRFRASGEARSAFHVECRVAQPGGSWTWVEASGLMEAAADGIPRRLPGILINIDQRRRAAERQAFLISLGDRLRTIDDPQAILDRTAEATGRHIDAELQQDFQKLKIQLILTELIVLIVLLTELIPQPHQL